ncbi:MAG: exodeoxyribonuclease subunit gamma [Pseudomonadota bacterium]|jgi:exodeoxyribonuclease V gamma subunit
MTAAAPAADLHPITPGLLVLHGNRLEDLRDAVLGWLALHPLAPLEEEVLLVQSNGAAEWLKMALAAATGVCAATRVELPARFLWRSYRQMLGELPQRSALDKDTLSWRLLRLLPVLAGQADFAPIAGFLRGDEPDRALQLAGRLADLFDQYQVYRADWLDAWARGEEVLIAPGSAAPVTPLPADQRWQAALWRAVLAELDDAQRAATRPAVHARFVQALLDGHAPQRPLPRRVVLFGAAQVPGQTLQALAALAQRCQVLLAVPNPCRYHWADIIEGRELLRSTTLRQRHTPRPGNEGLAQVEPQHLHQHAHPLLAAWGRQGRDFMRALDAFDDAEAASRRYALPGGELPRIDLFDHELDAERDAHHPPSLLVQVQRAIRDLVPLAELPRAVVARSDRSVVFHIAHSAQREVEILHDQLLDLLAQPPVPADDGGLGRALEPRDIVVMVPDVEVFAPAIRSVFGQVGREDARYIPFEIADLRQRGHNPLVLAMEWLLRAPSQRFGLAELKDLLDVPAVARRLGLDPAELPRLAAWMEGAGIRWGLHARQRAGLGLQACGEQNSAMFGLRRMLLGYAAGNSAAFAAGASSTSAADRGADSALIWPYDEIGGLEATVVGALDELLAQLSRWWALAAEPATPSLWAERGRALLDALFEPTDERERLTLAGLRGALSGWLEACATAGFDAAVPVEVLREAWLDGVDSPGSGRRFLAGGVTFCTLMPLRSVPFEVVCLLGMNDGDYPRATRRSDFDLLGWPGQARPGDRSRRDDDRYLMLEALLSARRALYISWSGRSLRDNSEQPPSVLVGQLRDYLGAGWRAADPPPDEPADQPATPQSAQRLLQQLSTEHPLQPFSRRYFEAPTTAEPDDPAMPRALLTYAREWRAAHADSAASSLEAPGVADTTGLPPFESSDQPVTLAQLLRFLKNPVKEFFRVRLHVVHPDDETPCADDEVFALDGLADWQLLSELAADPQGQVPPGATAAGAVAGLVQARLARATGSGRLPLAGPGQRVAQALQRDAEPMLAQWLQLQADYPSPAPQQALEFSVDEQGLRLQDWSDGLRTSAVGAEVVWISSTASKLMTKPHKKTGARQPVPDKLLDIWVRLLASAASGHATQAILLGRDACLQLAPLPAHLAAAHLAELLAIWRAGMQQPIPLPLRSALAAAADKDAQPVYDGSPYPGGRPGDCVEACLARCFPDYDALLGPSLHPLGATPGGSSGAGDGDDDDAERLRNSLFLDLAQRVYAPLLDWAATHHTVRPWAGAPADLSGDHADPGTDEGDD